MAAGSRIFSPVRTFRRAHHEVRRAPIGSSPVRAVLIVNPNATSTTAAGLALLAHALESRVHLTVARTDHRGHAIEIAGQAARDGVGVVIVHGGDGTVNEVVNGLLGKPGPLPLGPVPAVAVVPGRSVFRTTRPMRRTF